MPLNKVKLREAILFFASTTDPATLGRVKLMKMLYYLDFDHLERFRRSVTGDVYIHLEHGPVPKSSWSVIEEMVNVDLKVTHENVGAPNPRHVFTPLREPDLSIFADSEIEVLRQVGLRWNKASSDEIEKASHRELPWLQTELKQEVPKDLALRRHPGARMTSEYREALLQSIMSSLRQEGIDIPDDTAKRIFDEVEEDLWSEKSM